MFYLYRSTTERLSADLNRMMEAGDFVHSVHFTGGRDWVLIGIKSAEVE